MTVAAVILAATTESALADADGVASVRRLADVAWAGGAAPVVVVAADPNGDVARALANAPVTLTAPAPVTGGPVAQIARGISVARSLIGETSGALVWPARFTWVGPETVTSLLEAHGVAPDRILAPAYDGRRGWPVLVPLSALARLDEVGANRMPEDIVSDLADGRGITDVRLGDPGTVLDRTTARSDLPPYEGPVEPASGHVHEWGADVASGEEGPDGPLAGPALAPFGQAVDDEPDQPG